MALHLSFQWTKRVFSKAAPGLMSYTIAGEIYRREMEEILRKLEK